MKVKLIMIALILCLLPVMTLAEIEPSQGVERNGSIITLFGNYEEYTISGIETGVSIVVKSGVKRLTLDHASITAPEGEDALTAEDSLSLRLVGTNTIAGGSSYKDGGRGIVLPEGGKLTISGGSLQVSGGDALYEEVEEAVDGKGGTAIVGSVTIQDGAQVTATGGIGRSGYWEEDTYGGNGIEGSVEINGGQLTANGGDASQADHYNYGGDGVTGDAVVNDGQLIATGGSAQYGSTRNRGGDGITGKATVNGGSLTATGGDATDNNSTTSLIYNLGGHGVEGNAEVNSGSLTATGGKAFGGQITGRIQSENGAGHGVNGNAVIKGGSLTATGGGASESKVKNTGGNGVNGNFTAAGGYALAIGGAGDDDRMGKAAAAADDSLVIIGSEGKYLAASVGEGDNPNTALNDGKYYTETTTIAVGVSGKCSLETKEFMAVTYVCGWDGCDDSDTDYADCSQTYTVKTDAPGFDNHGFAFAGWVNKEGRLVESLTVTGPLTLYAGWKATFTFETGEGGTGSMPSMDAVFSGGTVRLPECGFSASAGYRFVGWKIEDDEKIYAIGEEIPAAGHIHLTAIWEPLPVLPATGDSGMPMLWMLLCLGSCGLLLLLRAKARD